MWETDDDRPRAAQRKPRDLSTMSMDELAGYVAELEAEITRVQLAIDHKQSVRGAADALFKSR